MSDQQFSIWLIDPAGCSPPLFLTTGYPHPDKQRLEFILQDQHYAALRNMLTYSLHITPISGKLPFIYDKNAVVAQAELSSVRLIKHIEHIEETGDAWAITDMFLPSDVSEAAYGPDIAAIPWSFQP